MKLTPTQVYNKLVHLQILAGSTMRQSNIFAVKHTWYYFNNQSEFLVQFIMTVYIVHVSRGSDFHGVYTDPEKAKLECFMCNEQDPFRYWYITPIELTTDSFMESILTNKDSK